MCLFAYSPVQPVLLCEHAVLSLLRPHSLLSMSCVLFRIACGFYFGCVLSCYVLCGHAVSENSHWLPVRVMFCLSTCLMIGFTGHELLILIMFSVSTWLIMFVSMCHALSCLLSNPALLVIWLLFHLLHLSSLVTRFVCSLFNLLVFSVPCEFVVYYHSVPVVSCSLPGSAVLC